MVVRFLAFLISVGNFSLISEHAKDIQRTRLAQTSQKEATAVQGVHPAVNWGVTGKEEKSQR